MFCQGTLLAHPDAVGTEKKKDQVRVLRIFKVRCSKHFYHSQRHWKVRSLLVTHGPEQRSQ